MPRRIGFPKRVLHFEALEQKRPLAVEVLSCGDADPDAVIAEEGSGSQPAAKSAHLNNVADDDTETAAENEDNELENEKSSNGELRVGESTQELADDDSAELDDDNSDDDDDESVTEDESDDEDEESEEDDSDEDESDEDESDEEESDEEESDEEESDEEESDEEESDEEESDEEDESEEEEDEDLDDEDDQDDDDSDEEEDDSEDDDDDDLEDDNEDEEDQADDDNESDDDDSDADDQDELDDEDDDDDENEADVEVGPMQSSDEPRETADDNPDAITSAVGFDVPGQVPVIVGFPTVEDSIQPFRSVRLSDPQLFDKDLIELLQVQPGNPSRDGRELAFDEIVKLANIGMVEPIGLFIEDELARAELQGPVQPALLDAVFESLDEMLSPVQ